MNILMASSEALPFSKTGGLADVSYSLSKEFAKLNNNVSLVIPFYKGIESKINKKLTKVLSYNVKMNWRNNICDVYHIYYENIDFYLIKNEQYFGRDNGLYGYYDDGERFAFFQLAIIELIKKLPYRIDVVHVHDWQTGMIPCLLKTKYSNHKVLSKIKTVLTIHNPLFKGYIFRESLFDLYNLPLSLFDCGKVRLDNLVSTLKSGIVFSDKITTVSITHRDELLTLEGSKGLQYDLILREYDFVGINNGVDEKEFNPRKDKKIYSKYNLSNVNNLKSLNKVDFCKVNCLNPDVPLFVVVSRLTEQKGLSVMYPMALEVINKGGNFAILGSGEFEAESFFNKLYKEHKDNSFVYIGYNDDLAHKLYAASDFFIMPSAFEPCGIGQMIAHRYGSIPIIRKTGGLIDTVNCLNIDYSNYLSANGIGFNDLDTNEAINSIDRAFDLYNNYFELFKKMRLNAMRANHSWKLSAKKYLDLYSSINK